MGKQLGACGLDCLSCEAYIATKKNDAAEVAKVAEAWTKQFGADIRPEHVWCDGCMSTSGRKCSHCAECEIRTCAVKQGVANCALCKEFPCKTISEFMAQVPPAKANLEEAHKAL
jgi:hypothetical protein